MTVYVSELDSNKFAKITAGNQKELLDFVAKLGLEKDLLCNESMPFYFCVSCTKRSMAIYYGAIEILSENMLEMFASEKNDKKKKGGKKKKQC